MKKGAIAAVAAAGVICAAVLIRIMTNEPFAEAAEAPVVEVSKSEVRDIVRVSSLVGTIEPEDVVYVYPKASGEVRELSVHAGDQVEAGQLLCVVDTKQVDSAKSTLDSAELALRQAKDELARQSVLYSGNGISEQEYQKYRDNVTAADISYQNAKTNYENQVSYSRITAPISGMIETCDIEVFDQLSQSNLICVISGEGARIVSFSATERIKNNLQVGDQVTVERDEGTCLGEIYEISTMADPASGLFSVKARLQKEGTESELDTGSMVKLSVISEHVNQVVTVPLDAVYHDGGSAYVYLYDESLGCLHKTEVETGLYDSDWMEIRTGLEPGAEVLSTWSRELYDGTNVRVKRDEAEKNEAE